MNIPDQMLSILPMLSVGAVVAAMITGFVSFLITLLSKEQKTSEFRQAWIDALRKDLAKFASLNLMTAKYIALNNKEDFFNEDLEIESLRFRIMLRLNHDEHKPLICEIRKLMELNDVKYKTLSPNDKKTLVSSFEQEASKVLKAEWKRVKRGERMFYIIKWSSFWSFIVLLVYTSAVLIDWLCQNYEISFVQLLASCSFLY